jgi:hypothetical protein
MPWSNKVDIWNVGVMVGWILHFPHLIHAPLKLFFCPFTVLTLSQTWDLFEDKHLFNAKDQNKENSSLHHLAEMIALLGPPPTDFVQRGDAASDYFDAHG